MNHAKKQEIASSFPTRYETGDLNVNISFKEFEVFDSGVFSSTMDEKWNIFVLKGKIHFAHSWTDVCIFQLQFSRNEDSVQLTKFRVNRNQKKHKSRDLNQDTILLKKLLQLYLNREDIYIDPKLNLPIIKNTILEIDPENLCRKSIGSNNVGLTRNIYEVLTDDEQRKYIHVIGWEELKQMISTMDENEPLISLYMQNRESKLGETYYFDKEGNRFLGKVRTEGRIRSS